MIALYRNGKGCRVMLLKNDMIDAKKRQTLGTTTHIFVSDFDRFDTISHECTTPQTSNIIRKTSLIRLLFLLGHLHLSGIYGMVWLQERMPYVGKKDWTTCSKHDNHPIFSLRHNWEDLYDHSTST